MLGQQYSARELDVELTINMEGRLRLPSRTFGKHQVHFQRRPLSSKNLKRSCVAYLYSAVPITALPVWGAKDHINKGILHFG